MPKALLFRILISLLFFVVCPLGSQSQQVVHFPGLIPVGTTTPAQTVTVTLSAGGAVSQVNVFTQGSLSLDFGETGDTCKSTAPLLAGDTCTVTATFKPTAPGPLSGAVVLLDSR